MEVTDFNPNYDPFLHLTKPLPFSKSYFVHLYETLWQNVDIWKWAKVDSPGGQKHNNVYFFLAH